MKRHILSSLLLLTAMSGQSTGLHFFPEGENSDFASTRERIYVGGDFNLWFSNYGGVVNISPMGGYKWTKGFMTGAGLTYQYTSGYDYYNTRFVNHMFGWRVFARQDVVRFLFVNAEYENYYTKVYDWISAKYAQRAIPVGNVGVGFKRNFSDRSYYQILIQYDLIQDRFTQYYVYPLAPLSLKFGFVVCLDDIGN